MLSIDKVAIARLLALITAVTAATTRAAVTLTSPNEQLQMTVDVNGSGHLAYKVDFKGKAVVEESDLGVTVGGSDLGAGATLGAATPNEADETYPWRGVKSLAVNRYYGAVIPVTKGGQNYSLEARVFNDGVAFRYVVPGSGSRTVSGEATSFRIPAASKVWYQLVNARHDYESPFTSADVAALPAAAQMFAVVTYELPGGGYAALTEAYLRNYCGMYYLNKGDRTLQALFPSASWTLDGAFESPWRVVLVGADLNTLVNTDIIHNLNPPPAAGAYDAPWVTQGLAVWNYLGNFHAGNTMDLQKRYSRQAGEMGITHNTIDAGFGGSLGEIADYSKQQGKGVRVLIWRHCSGLKDRNARRSWFQSLQTAGIAGAKIDFIESEQKDAVDFYENTLKDAAEFHQLIIFHGSNKPTGQDRTYPNFISSEGIKGLEHARLKPDDQADCINPFTRLLAGPADYTPLSFDPTPGTGRMGKTSAAHQIGTIMTYTTPIQNLSVDPAVLVTHPAIKFITAIPTVWDETRVLPMSKIGDLCAMARRKGNTWFVAFLSGSPEAKTIEFNTSVLGVQEYEAAIVADKPESQTDVAQSAQRVGAGATLTVQLRPFGGWAGRLEGQGGVFARSAGAARPGRLALSRVGGAVTLRWEGDAAPSLSLLSADGKALWSRSAAGRNHFGFSLPEGRGAYWLRARTGGSEEVRRLLSF
jgi:alpha-glucosidase